jgi:tetratricopeptide (TPR) repeat protein
VRGAVELPRQLTIEAALDSSDEREQRTLAAEYLARGRTFFAQERDREAADALNRALFISPYDADANLLLGRLHLRNGRPREAVDALKISLWSRESAGAHLVLAQAYLALKERSAAVDEARRALALDPTLTEARDIVDDTGDIP